MLSLARVFERASRYERSELEYRRALSSQAPEARVPALVGLAARAKRCGDREAAAALWERAAREGDDLALRELAMHWEHRRRDYSAALELVEEALERFGGQDSPRSRRFVTDFARRRDRLRRKLSWSAPSPNVRRG
jgi:tetratricopeptide (TPR) repeat protein